MSQSISVMQYSLISSDARMDGIELFWHWININWANHFNDRQDSKLLRGCHHEVIWGAVASPLRQVNSKKEKKKEKIYKSPSRKKDEKKDERMKGSIRITSNVLHRIKLLLITNFSIGKWITLIAVSWSYRGERIIRLSDTACCIDLKSLRARTNEWIYTNTDVSSQIYSWITNSSQVET